ncbi:4Fe-4S dicluster domain-containing protein [Chloroflexota bacterium]
MTTKVLRKIINIDEEKCNGCGDCAIACAEGALEIVDGKAKLISQQYCDGLGACLGECPQGAITIEEREAEQFDEEATQQHLEAKEDISEALPCGCPSSTVAQFERPVVAEEAKAGEALPCGCPSTTMARFERPAVAEEAKAGEALPCGCPSTTMARFERPAVSSDKRAAPSSESTLGHWPVQLTLVPPTAPFLQGADVLLAADCVPFAYSGFHQDFLRDHALLVACPKLDDYSAHLRKLTDILSQSSLKSLTVLHMEVPCCLGLVHMAKEAVRLSGKDIPFKEVTVGTRGDLKP